MVNEYFTTNGRTEEHPCLLKGDLGLKYWLHPQNFDGPSLEEIHNFFEKVALEESVDVRDLRLYCDGCQYSVYLHYYKNT